MVDIIHGATGAQGSPVLSALTAAGRTAIAAVRHPEAVPDGIAARQVDLASADSLASAYEGADGVFVHLPMGAPEATAAQARAVVEAVDRTRPGRVVISTSGQIVDRPDSPLQATAGSPIMTLIDGVTGSGVPTAVVAPRLYLENLLLPVVLAPTREEGVLRYPLPTSFPVSWSSHLDVAEVVARLLKRAGEQGRADDTEPVIRHRLEIYAESTAPLAGIYAERGLLVQVDGMGEIDVVTGRILEALAARGITGS